MRKKIENYFIEKINVSKQQQVVKLITRMEQVAIITQLVQEMVALNCSESEMAHFILNLDTAVKTLTYIKEDIPRQRARDLRWEAGRAEREAKEAKEKEEKRLIQERQEEYKKEKQRHRRRELYQLKKAEKEWGGCEIDRKKANKKSNTKGK
jgi:hypothetical protein